MDPGKGVDVGLEVKEAIDQGLALELERPL
jgi:hypothetical protein